MDKDDREEVIDALLRKNLELHTTVRRLTQAIINHQLNTSRATPVDRRLWEMYRQSGG